jgi:signal transduction histidine kinase
VRRLFASFCNVEVDRQETVVSPVQLGIDEARRVQMDLRPSLMDDLQDNGRGFDLGERSSREDGEKGFGLTSMRERTELSGGSFSLDSVKGKGTRIQTSWPGCEEA